MLPSQQVLEQIARKVKSIPNRKKESKRRVHFGLFLLGYKSGLRVNEAVKFDLSSKTKQGLYRIEKPKGKKERYIYVPNEVIRELKKQNWQPNQTNCWNFYHFLRKIKRELNISPKIELTPHTLRRAFATYQAENGLPLPLLQKLLGHSSIRTTALYWQNIYGDDDPSNILAGKKWLENGKPSEPPAEAAPVPITEPSFLIGLPKEPIINSPPITAELLPVATNTKPQPLITKTPIQPTEKILSNVITETKSPDREQLPVIVNEREQPNAKEQILLTKIQQLEEQLKQTRAKNNNLTNQLAKSEQAKKELTVKLANSEKSVQTEKQRANYYKVQLKTIAKTLYQWQKINYCQQLEQEQQAQIIQLPPDK